MKKGLEMVKKINPGTVYLFVLPGKTRIKMDQTDLPKFISTIQNRKLGAIPKVEEDFSKFTRWSNVVKQDPIRIDLSKSGEKDFFDRIGRIVYDKLLKLYFAELDQSLSQLYYMIPDELKRSVEKEHKIAKSRAEIAAIEDAKRAEKAAENAAEKEKMRAWREESEKKHKEAIQGLTNEQKAELKKKEKAEELAEKEKRKQERIVKQYGEPTEPIPVGPGLDVQPVPEFEGL